MRVLDSGRILRQQHRSGSTAGRATVIERAVVVHNDPTGRAPCRTTRGIRRGAEAPAAEVGRIEKLRGRKSSDTDSSAAGHRPDTAALARGHGVPIGLRDRPMSTGSDQATHTRAATHRAGRVGLADNTGVAIVAVDIPGEPANAARITAANHGPQRVRLRYGSVVHPDQATHVLRVLITGHRAGSIRLRHRPEILADETADFPPHIGPALESIDVGRRPGLRDRSMPLANETAHVDVAGDVASGQTDILNGAAAHVTEQAHVRLGRAVYGQVRDGVAPAVEVADEPIAAVVPGIGSPNGIETCRAIPAGGDTGIYVVAQRVTAGEQGVHTLHSIDVRQDIGITAGTGAARGSQEGAPGDLEIGRGKGR